MSKRRYSDESGSPSRKRQRMNNHNTNAYTTSSSRQNDNADNAMDRWRPSETHSLHESSEQPSRSHRSYQPHHAHHRDTHYPHYSQNRTSSTFDSSSHRPKYRNNDNNRNVNMNHASTSSRASRAPIEECDLSLMHDIQRQHKHNISGIQQIRVRDYVDSKWKEYRIDSGSYYYIKNNDKTTKQTLKPEEIKNTEFKESYKPYQWIDDVDKLKPEQNKSNNKDKDMLLDEYKLDSFPVKTNTFPITIKEGIDVLFYDTKTRPKDDKSSTIRFKDLKQSLLSWKNKSILSKYFDEFLVINSTIITFKYSNDKSGDEHVKLPDDFHPKYYFSFNKCRRRPITYYLSLKREENKLDDDEKDEIKDDNNDGRTYDIDGTQLLQYILNFTLKSCDLKFICKPPARGYFGTNINSSLCKVDYVYPKENDYRKRNIGVIRGINAKINLTVNGLTIKVNTIHKLIEAQSIRDKMRHSNGNMDSLIHSQCIVLYSHQEIEIKEIQMKENENTDNGSGQSHAVYLKNKGYINDVLQERHGLIKDKKGFTHLPQCLHAKITDNDDNNKKDALIHLSKDVHSSLDNVEKYIKFIVHKQQDISNNDNNKSKKVNISTILKINKYPIETTGVKIPSISIRFKQNSNMNSERFSKYNQNDIAKNWRNVKGVISGPKEPTNILLIGNNKQQLLVLQDIINQYKKKREFHSLLRCSDIEVIDIDNENDPSFKHLVESSSKKYHIFFIIIPSCSDMNQSSILKRKLHRLCIEHGRKTQFIFASHFKAHFSKKRNVIWGAMGDVMIKCGYTLYDVDPMLDENISNLLHINDSLYIGLDVAHPKQTDNRPSIAVVSCFRNIFEPSSHDQRTTIYLNDNRQEIMSKDALVACVYDCIKKQLKRNSTKQLPKNIFFFRDGISNSQIPEFVSKEMKGIEQGLMEVKRNKDLKKKFGGLLADWTPNMEVMIIQKRILDKFGAIQNNNNNNNNRIYDNHPAFIIPWDIVSGEWFEFYLEIGTRNPMRIIFIRDDLKLKKYTAHIAKFIYSMHWCYPYIIPFNGGPVNVVSPIKWADHHANNWQEMIFNTDRNINDIKIKMKNVELIKL